jgi:hypothetical protein
MTVPAKSVLKLNQFILFEAKFIQIFVSDIYLQVYFSDQILFIQLFTFIKNISHPNKNNYY